MFARLGVSSNDPILKGIGYSYPYLQLENTHKTNSKTAPMPYWHTILHMIYLIKLAGYQIDRAGNTYVAQFFLSFFSFVLYSDLVMSFCLFSFLCSVL